MLDKIFFQCRWVKVKKSRGLITIKTGVGILEQSRNYVHFTDATETNFEIFFFFSFFFFKSRDLK